MADDFYGVNIIHSNGAMLLLVIGNQHGQGLNVIALVGISIVGGFGADQASEHLCCFGVLGFGANGAKRKYLNQGQESVSNFYVRHYFFR